MTDEDKILALFNTELDLVALEKEMAKFPQVEEDLEHIFAGGVYIRQLRLPKDAMIIGKRHRHSTCNVLMDGELTLYVGGGEPPQRMKGPFIFESAPNVKKMFYCHTDVVFMNFHPTKLTDLEQIEDEFIIPEREYLIGGAECLG
jgi:hypothetical protein